MKLLLIVALACLLVLSNASSIRPYYVSSSGVSGVTGDNIASIAVPADTSVLINNSDEVSRVKKSAGSGGTHPKDTKPIPVLINKYEVLRVKKSVGEPHPTTTKSQPK